jgi:hypothetical protein
MEDPTISRWSLNSIYGSEHGGKGNDGLFANRGGLGSTMKKSLLFPFTILITLSACGDKPKPEQQNTSGGHVWSDMTGTIDKAKAVDATVQDAIQKQNQVIDKMGQ